MSLYQWLHQRPPQASLCHPLRSTFPQRLQTGSIWGSKFSSLESVSSPVSLRTWGSTLIGIILHMMICVVFSVYFSSDSKRFYCPLIQFGTALVFKLDCKPVLYAVAHLKQLPVYILFSQSDCGSAEAFLCWGGQDRWLEVPQNNSRDLLYILFSCHLSVET